MDRWLSVVVVVGITALLLMGLAAPKTYTIEAQKLVLKDKAGKPRAVLQLDDHDEPQLDLRAASGPVRTTLDANTGLGLIGPEGTRRATLRPR